MSAREERLVVQRGYYSFGSDDDADSDASASTSIGSESSLPAAILRRKSTGLSTPNEVWMRRTNSNFSSFRLGSARRNSRSHHAYYVLAR